MEAVWLCECGKTVPQELDGPVKEKCECGKPLTKLKGPDGVIQEYVPAPDWFVKEFVEQDGALFTMQRDFGALNAQRVNLDRKVNELFDKIQNGHKKMQNIVEQGARRLHLLKRQDLAWNYQHNIRRFVGTPKPPKPPEVKK